MNGTWMVRAGRNAVNLDLFLDEGCVTMGISPFIGQEALNDDRAALLERVKTTHPDLSTSAAANRAGQLYRFLHELREGDTVVTYDPSQRRYILGEAKGTATCTAPDDFRRSVVWNRRVMRDVLSVPTKNSLGSIQTIFTLNQEASKELLESAVPLSSPERDELPPPPKPTEEERDGVKEILERSKDLIEERILRLEPYAMQDLMAGVLRAMGYKTRTSSKGADRGVDIFASPDGLGLQEPRIFVEVKHRRAAMGSQEIRSFLGGRQPGDRCLFLSTGGFTKEARYEAERSNIPLTLIDLPALRELLTEHYENLDTETRQLMPLAKSYWPVDND